MTTILSNNFVTLSGSIDSPFQDLSVPGPSVIMSEGPFVPTIFEKSLLQSSVQ